MAAQNSFQGEPKAFENAVFFEGFDAVLRTRRGKPATVWKPRRNRVLIDANQQNKREGKGVLQYALTSIPKFIFFHLIFSNNFGNWSSTRA